MGSGHRCAAVTSVNFALSALLGESFLAHHAYFCFKQALIADPKNAKTQLRMIDPGFLSQAICMICVSTVLYSITLVIYRLFLHPLARFPGPKLAAATKWYEFYYDVVKKDGGTYMYEIDRMHQTFGKHDRYRSSIFKVSNSMLIPERPYSTDQSR